MNIDNVKMNKQEATQKIEVLEKELADLKKIVNSPEESFSEMFWALILQTDSIRLDKEKYPNSTFGFHGDKFLWEYNSKNAYLLLSYARIWSFLERNYNDVQSLIKSEVEEHFKCKGVAPELGLNNTSEQVEEHFKCKGVAPISDRFVSTCWVEEHFKCKGVTPTSELDGEDKGVEEHFKCKGVTPTLYFTWIFPWWKTTWKKEKQGNIQSSNQTSKK